MSMHAASKWIWRLNPGGQQLRSMSQAERPHTVLNYADKLSLPVQIFGALSALNPSVVMDPAGLCQTPMRLFASGRCLMQVGEFLVSRRRFAS
jgi:hypothetical protein